MVQKKIGKKRSKTQLTPGQQNTIFKLTVALVFIGLLWILFSPQMGVLFFHKQKKQLEHLQQKTVELQKENVVLSEKIDHLLNDPKYLEKLAREKYGLLKKNERIYDFSEEKSNQKK